MVSALTDKVDIYAGGNLVLQSEAITSINAKTAIKLKTDGYLSMHSMTLSDIKSAGSWVFESTTGAINILAANQSDGNIVITAGVDVDIDYTTRK